MVDKYNVFYTDPVGAGSIMVDIVTCTTEMSTLIRFCLNQNTTSIYSDNHAGPSTIIIYMYHVSASYYNILYIVTCHERGSLGLLS